MLLNGCNLLSRAMVICSHFLRFGKEYLNKFIAKNRLIFVLPNLCISNLNAVYYFYLYKEIWEKRINKLGPSCGKPKIECLSRCG